MWMQDVAPGQKVGETETKAAVVESAVLIEIAAKSVRPAATTPALRPRRAIRFLTNLTRRLLWQRWLQTPQ